MDVATLPARLSGPEGFGWCTATSLGGPTSSLDRAKSSLPALGCGLWSIVSRPRSWSSVPQPRRLSRPLPEDVSGRDGDAYSDQIDKGVDAAQQHTGSGDQVP
ncbi:MAG TPA: antitoxin [Kineosporiaceae bacterium]|nr:antitoxin [Kineosporiaceae bacterium]